MAARDSFLVGVSLAALCGCPSTTATQASQSSSGASSLLTQSVGPGGGTVSVPGGPEIQIPAGALAATISVSVAPAASIPAPKGASWVGGTFVFGPEGTQFASPVTVTLPFAPGELPAGATASEVAIYTAPAGSAAYTALPTTLSDPTHVRAQVTHFSDFGPAVGSAPFCGDGLPGSYPLPDGGVAVKQCDWGDGEDGEACTGPDGGCNSDTQPNACRTNCLLPTCGDGVVDTGERCDLGAENGTEQGCNATCTLIGKATRIAGNGDLIALPDGGTSLCPIDCYVDGPGNQAQFDGIAGLAVVGRTLYVADTRNEVVRAVDLTSPAYTVSTLAGDAGVPGTDVQACSTTQDGTGNGACFFLPVKPFAYEPPGQAPTLLVGTSTDVRQITLGPNGGVVTTFAGPDTGNRTSENPSFPASFTQALFNDVTGIAVDSATGDIYTVDMASGFIHRLDPAAQLDYCLVGGNATTTPSCPSHAAFSDPKSAVILAGGMFLTDQLNNYVRHLTLPGPDAGEDVGTAVTNVAGNGGPGFADSDCDGGALLNEPSGICTDGFTLYVVDSKNQAVRQIDPVTYQVTTVIGGPGTGIFDNPDDCAWDPDAGVLYVSDQSATTASPYGIGNVDGIGNVIYMIQ